MYSISQAAKALHISCDTLRRWDKTGELVAMRRRSGHRYYTQSQIQDALGRTKGKPFGTDMDSVVGKVVLITGGTGSLGHRFVSRIAPFAKKVIVFSRCELKQATMRQEFHSFNNIRYLIGDVRDEQRLNMALRDIDICVHAAAMKRIEICSREPFEAIKTNVIGSMNVVNACIENKVGKAVMVSTDKATSAATLYGGSKFVAEQAFINANNYVPRDDVRFTCVRYGNIYGSNGSIKHLFTKQAETEGKISITHDEMTRFFMSLDNSVDLVLHAIANGIGGEIFIPKMKAISIMDFANIFFPDVQKEVIGIRGPEKIHEELISETESRFVVDCNDKFYKIIPPSVNIPGLGWDLEYPCEKVMKPFKYTSNNVERLTKEELMAFEQDYGEKHK